MYVSFGLTCSIMENKYSRLHSPVLWIMLAPYFLSLTQLSIIQEYIQTALQMNYYVLHHNRLKLVTIKSNTFTTVTLVFFFLLKHLIYLHISFVVLKHIQGYIYIHFLDDNDHILWFYDIIIQITASVL